MTPTIAARGIAKRFGVVRALRSVDLEVHEGEALAVLGPNGAGKSTLLKILAGLSRPTAGSLEIEGRRHSASDAGGLRAHIGYVGHATLLYPELTARENLVFAGRLYDVADPAARADVLLEDAGLAHVSDRRAGTFSRGMAQRLSIARSLVHEPQLVLLDEPFSGLDRLAADRLAARLQALRGGSRSIVLVTHDVRQACEVATRAVVLGAGRIVHTSPGPTLDLQILDAACADAAIAESAA